LKLHFFVYYTRTISTARIGKLGKMKFGCMAPEVWYFFVILKSLFNTPFKMLPIKCKQKLEIFYVNKLSVCVLEMLLWWWTNKKLNETFQKRIFPLFKMFTNAWSNKILKCFSPFFLFAEPYQELKTKKSKKIWRNKN